MPDPLRNTKVSDEIETVLPASAPGVNEPMPRATATQVTTTTRASCLNFNGVDGVNDQGGRTDGSLCPEL
jgi:hypothetical protein